MFTENESCCLGTVLELNYVLVGNGYILRMMQVCDVLKVVNYETTDTEEWIMSCV
jgi:hypothetical protein